MRRFEKKRVSSMNDKKKSTLIERMSKKIDNAKLFLLRQNQRGTETSEDQQVDSARKKYREKKTLR